MFKRFAVKTLTIAAIATAALASVIATASFVRWATRPSPRSPAGLLAQADQLAWNNNWLGAFPLYARAERLFQEKGDEGRALYAHVSQFAVKMESSDLALLIAQLDHELHLPAAAAPDVRLRILEMKAKCEQEYDAGIAIKTFAEIQRLALRQHNFYLASRASGEQGILAFTLGNLAEARSRVKRAYAIAKYFGDPAAHVRYAEMIGLGIENLGRPKQALQFLEEAITTQRQHPEVALPSVAYGAKITSLGDLGRYDEAFALADQVINFPRQHRMYGQLQSLLTSRADVLVRAGKVNEAISGYQEALNYAKTIHSWRAITNIDAKLAAAYEQLGALPQALSAIDDAIEANEQIPQEMFFIPGNMAIKARVLMKLGRRAEAERLYIKARDVLDALLTHVPTPDAERLLLTELGELYSGFFGLLSDQGRYTDAFHVIEQAHGRIEAQQLEYDHTEIPHSPTPDDRRLQQLEIDLVKVDDQRKRTDILHEIQASQKNSPIETADKTASLVEVQKQLEPDELLIEYVLADRQSYALAISSSRTTHYVLPTKRVIEADVGKYRAILREQRTDSQVGQQLFRELLGFTHNYPESRSIIIVADGALHLLPFSALIDESGKYMLERASFSMTPSGTVLNLLRARDEAASVKRPYLGVAAWTGAEDKRPWVLRAVSADAKNGDLPALPESRDEVESIAAMMPQPSTVLIGQEATRQKFESLPLGDYRVLHLALHGLIDPVYPDRSALVFARTNTDNGRLEARDIRRLHLKAELVTLSACDTGVGPVGAAGVESIDTAFIEAGASSVVSTLWELEDRSSSRLMKDFYRRLNQESKADALRSAKLDLLRAGLVPYYWAGYEIVGDSRKGLFASK